METSFSKNGTINRSIDLQSDQLTGLYMIWVSTESNFRTDRSIPANIRLDKDVLKTSWRCFSSSSSGDVFITANKFALALRLQKTSSKCLGQDQYIRLGYMSSRRVAKMSSRRFGDVFKASSRHLQDVFKTSCKNVFRKSSRRLQDIFKTFSRRLAKISSRRFQGVSSS